MTSNSLAKDPRKCLYFYKEEIYYLIGINLKHLEIEQILEHLNTSYSTNTVRSLLTPLSFTVFPILSR